MSEISEAAKALRAFMKEMAAWESKSSKLVDKAEEDDLDIDEVETKQMLALSRIQETHCTDSKWRRSEFNVTSPSEYDLKGNRLISSTLEPNGCVFIEMQQDHLANGIMKIEMAKVGVKWKVSRRWVRINNQKPIACQL